MSIRIRRIDNRVVALCAAESEPESGDIYLDDNIDHALRMKFIRDYEFEGVDFGKEVAGEEYTLYYDRECRQIIYGAYREDVELFGYTF